MKRGVGVLIFIFLGVILLTGFVSAGWFSDLFQKPITGNVIADKMSSNLASGLVSYWSFDSADGSTNSVAKDIIGSFNGAVLGPVMATGLSGDDYSFDGLNDYITVSSPINITGELTVSVWFKPTNLAGGTSGRQLIIGKWNEDSKKRSWEIGMASGVPFFYVSDNGDWGTHIDAITASSAVSANNWHHFVATHATDGTIKIFIDGTLAGLKTTAMTSLYASNQPVIIGDSPMGGYIHNYFSGGIDEVGIWNRVLSASEISALYEGYGGSTTPTCTSFTYSAWGACSPSEIQTRTAIGVPSGCTGGNPVLSQICVYVPNPIIPVNNIVFSTYLGDTYTSLSRDTNEYGIRYSRWTNQNGEVQIGKFSSINVDEDRQVVNYYFDSTSDKLIVNTDNNQYAYAKFTSARAGIVGEQILTIAYDTNSLSNAVNAILAHQSTVGGRGYIHVLEGEPAKIMDWIVINQGDAGTILNVDDISIDTSTQATVTFSDAITGESQKVTLNYNGSNSFVKTGVNFFGGTGYSIKTSNASAAVYTVSITWGAGSSPGNAGSDTVIAPKIKLKNGNWIAMGTLNQIRQAYNLDVSGTDPAILFIEQEGGMFVVPIGPTGNGEIGVSMPHSTLSTGLSPTTTQTCTDSDVTLEYPDGLNYYLRGTTSGSAACADGPCPYQVSVDACKDSFNLDEFHCSNYDGWNYLVWTGYTCPNGCNNGACANPPIPVCFGLINAVKNPVSTPERTLSWNNTYNGTTWINGQTESFTEYYTGWYSNSAAETQPNYYYAGYDVQVFDNSNIDLSEYASWNSEDPACKTSSFWADNRENFYYICNWNALNNIQDTSNPNYQSNHRQIFWYNDNVVVRIYIYWGNQLTDAQVTQLAQQRLNQLMNNLQNNQYQYIDWSNFNIASPASNEIYDSLQGCTSDVQQTVERSWNCITEPIVCPPHGEQTRKCIAYNNELGEEETYETTMSCNPGICAGCMVPKWFGSRWQSKCIPYGFRILQPDGTSETVYADDFTPSNSPVKLIINNEGTASINVVENFSDWLSSRGEGNYNFNINVNGQTFNGLTGEILNIYEGATYTINYQVSDDTGQQESENFVIYIDNIFYSEDSAQSYLKIVYREDYPAYCEIDGHIWQQKSTVPGQDFGASCQNNYECESNLCSAGSCVEVKKIVEDASFFRRAAVTLLCRLSSIFRADITYEQCLVDYLGGEIPTTETPTA